MADDFVTRLRTIASEIFSGKHVEVTASGENYYSFAILTPNAEGGGSMFPTVWIAPSASDQQIREKLSREFAHALHPEAEGDDLSVPNLQNEGKQRE